MTTKKETSTEEFGSIEVIKKDKDYMRSSKDLVALADDVKSLEANDDMFHEKANGYGATLLDAEKYLKTKVTTYTKSATQYVKDVRSLFKPVQEMVALSSLILKATQRERWQTEEKEKQKQRKILEEKARREEEKHRAKVEKAIENNKPAPERKPFIAPVIDESKTKRTETGKTTYVEVWKWELDDISKLADNLIVKTPNKKVIDAMIKSGTKEIEGLKIIKDVQVRRGS